MGKTASTAGKEGGGAKRLMCRENPRENTTDGEWTLEARESPVVLSPSYSGALKATALALTVFIFQHTPVRCNEKGGRPE
jgi:hypothetical protein